LSFQFLRIVSIFLHNVKISLKKALQFYPLIFIVCNSFIVLAILELPCLVPILRTITTERYVPPRAPHMSGLAENPSQYLQKDNNLPTFLFLINSFPDVQFSRLTDSFVYHISRSGSLTQIRLMSVPLFYFVVHHPNGSRFWKVKAAANSTIVGHNNILHIGSKSSHLVPDLTLGHSLARCPIWPH
jgi:hypothetical protein